MWKFEQYFSGMKYQMPESLYSQYIKEYVTCNEWVRKTYFPGRDKLFRDKHFKSEDQEIIPELECEKIAGLLADIWQKNKNIE